MIIINIINKEKITKLEIYLIHDKMPRFTRYEYNISNIALYNIINIGIKTDCLLGYKKVSNLIVNSCISLNVESRIFERFNGKVYKIEEFNRKDFRIEKFNIILCPYQISEKIVHYINLDYLCIKLKYVNIDNKGLT